MAKAITNGFVQRDKKIKSKKNKSLSAKMLEKVESIQNDDTVETNPQEIEVAPTETAIEEVSPVESTGEEVATNEEPSKENENIELVGAIIEDIETIEEGFSKADESQEENTPVETEKINIPPVVNKEETPKAKSSKKGSPKVITKQVFVENLDENFFKLNVQQKETDGKLTSARVNKQIADKVREYASIKAYQVIEFTNKLLSIGVNDLHEYDMSDIAKVKLRAGGSTSLMYNNNNSVNEAITEFINKLAEEGYTVSKNLVINLILDKMIEKFE